MAKASARMVAANLRMVACCLRRRDVIRASRYRAVRECVSPRAVRRSLRHMSGESEMMCRPGG